MRAILLSGGLALVFTLLGTRLAIRLLVAKGYGQLIRDDLRPGDVVLVKASRGARLDRVAEALLAPDEVEAP